MSENITSHARADAFRRREGDEAVTCTYVEYDVAVLHSRRARHALGR